MDDITRPLPLGVWEGLRFVIVASLDPYLFYHMCCEHGSTVLIFSIT